MFKRLIAALAVMLAVGTAVVAIQSPAQAAPYCPSNSICLYSNSEGGGSMLALPSMPGACYSLGGGWNNVTSSLLSNLGYAVHLKDNWDCTGSGFYVGYAIPNYVSYVGGWPDFYNDKASSIQFWN